MTRAVYAFPHLGGIECGLVRLRGVGLANCLFPWARCVVASKRFGLRRIAATWPQLCHRQWLRGDRDKRAYLRLFDETRHTIAGLRKLALLSTAPHISEEDFHARPESFKKGVVVFRGMENYFKELLGDHQFIRESLLATIRTEHTIGLDADPSRTIYAHVRRGDFAEPGGARNPNQLHVRQPLEWFIELIQQIRTRSGSSINVAIFSDGSDEELRPLLAIPRTRRVSFGSSVADLLALSKARVLLASGSTFSMWAAYLGRMPVIWPAGQLRQRLYDDRDREIEFDRGTLPHSSMDLIHRELVA